MPPATGSPQGFINFNYIIYTFLNNNSFVSNTVNVLAVIMAFVAIVNIVVYFNRTCVGNSTTNNYCRLKVINNKHQCNNENPLNVNLGLRDTVVYSNFLLFILTLIMCLFMGINIFYINPITNITTEYDKLIKFILLIVFVITSLYALVFVGNCYSKPTDCQVTTVRDKDNNIVVSCKPTERASDNTDFVLLNIVCLVAPGLLYILN